METDTITINLISDLDALPFSEASPLLMDMLEQGKVQPGFNNTFRFLQHTGYYISPTTKYLVLPSKLQNYLRRKYSAEGSDLVNLYDTFFDEYLTYLTDNLIQFLPFDLSDIFFSGQYTPRQPALFMKLLVLLRYEELLDSSFQHVLRFPHAIDKFVYEESVFENVHTIDEQVIDSIIQRPWSWRMHSEGILAVGEERYMPQTVLQPRHYFSFDNVENRFIKYLLMDIVSTCGEISERYKQYASIVSKAKRINEKCKAFLGNELFTGVGEMIMFPDHSQVLIKKDGYRDLFHIYLRLNTALENEKAFEADSAITMKDMATLWEYYVFIRLMKILRQKFGNEVKATYNPDVKGYYGLYDKAVVYFRTGESLEYQRPSSSYSDLNWRPDFIFRSAGKSMVLDAKFRIYENAKDDLMKNMHYYKDGLTVDSAVALSFGEWETGVLFSEDAAKSNLYFESLDEVLFNNMRGVGYFSLKPELI